MARIRFTNIPEAMYKNYPPQHRARLQEIHSDIIEYMTTHYRNQQTQRNQVLAVMNTVSYKIVQGEQLPRNWSSKDPLRNIQVIENDQLEKVLGKLFLETRNVEFDLSVSDDSEPYEPRVASTPVVTASKPKKSAESPKTKPLPGTKKVQRKRETPKSDLYIQPPVVPHFDYSHPYITGTADGSSLCIYPSLPKIPTKQNEISVTTDVKLMTDRDLMRLFPDHLIQTRSPAMYQPLEGVRLDPKLGLILPISGFTDDQVIDNIIRYPHIFKLMKLIDGKSVSFYSTVELNGELHKISDVWKSLPEADIVPYNTEFIKEYVVRRYLLERDINKVEHRYTLQGELHPFLTLFTTPDDYAKFGYSDSIEIARSCVESRVAYKRSRNPIIRRLENE